MRYYIYKITFQSGRTYIGQHTERKANDKYVTSSVVNGLRMVQLVLWLMNARKVLDQAVL